MLTRSWGCTSIRETSGSRRDPTRTAATATSLCRKIRHMHERPDSAICLATINTLALEECYSSRQERKADASNEVPATTTTFCRCNKFPRRDIRN